MEYFRVGIVGLTGSLSVVLSDHRHADLEDALRVLEVLDAAHESSLSGRRISMSSRG